MAPSRFWDFVYLWSNYHLEHHYFPGVPFYNLRALHIELRPFFAERGMVRPPTAACSGNGSWRTGPPTPTGELVSMGETPKPPAQPVRHRAPERAS